MSKTIELRLKYFKEGRVKLIQQAVEKLCKSSKVRQDEGTYVKLSLYNPTRKKKGVEVECNESERTPELVEVASS